LSANGVLASSLVNSNGGRCFWQGRTPSDVISMVLLLSAEHTVLLLLLPLARVCLLQAGVLIRGNLRTDRLKVFESVCDKVQELFGDKYKVLMIEDPEAFADGPPGPPSSSAGRVASGSKGDAAAQQEPRVAFQVGWEFEFEFGGSRHVMQVTHRACFGSCFM
jgi:hypothetical protein